MSSKEITLFGDPRTLETFSVRKVVGLLKRVLRTKRRVSERHTHLEEWPICKMEGKNSRREQVRNWIDNNILSNNSVRQLLWDEAQTDSWEEVEDLCLVLLSPGLRTLEIVTDGGVSRAGTAGNFYDRLTLPQETEWRIRRRSINILENVRDLVDRKQPLQIRKFHYQGSEEYSAAESNEILEKFFSPGGNIFPENIWTKLSDLSLVYFDWSWCNYEAWVDVKQGLYLESAYKFFQSIGQYLPSLSHLEITHPQILSSKGYLWLFLSSPENAHKVLLEQGVSQLICREMELNPICFRLENFKIYDLTEHHDIFAAIVKWCRNLKTFDLPEVNFYNNEAPEDDEIEAEFYRNNFLVTCLHKLLQYGHTDTSLYRLKIEDPLSSHIRGVWDCYSCQLPRDDPISVILLTIVQAAHNVRELYIGNNAQNFALDDLEAPQLLLTPGHVSRLGQLSCLTALELENIEVESVEAVLRMVGTSLSSITLTNILLDLGRLLDLAARVESLHMRNTRVVLSDEADHTLQLPWTEPSGPINNRLERLSIDYTVSLEMAEWLMTGGLSRLTGLSLGHARQRYSQHSSVARLTPSRWASLLARCHLPHLQRLEIPVLFQPEDTDPGSQVSILDLEDVLNIFKVLPRLNNAMLHRRQYKRCGEQANFPVFPDNLGTGYPRHIGLINVMDF